MGSKKIRLGSISLLFTVILLCVVVLSVLSVSTARADKLLAEHTAEAVSARYELQNEGQLWLAEVDGILREHPWGECGAYLPEGAVLEGDAITATLKTGDRNLNIKLERDLTKPEGYRIALWRESVDWKEDQSLNLF